MTTKSIGYRGHSAFKKIKGFRNRGLWRSGCRLYTENKIKPIQGVNTEWSRRNKGHFAGSIVKLDLCQSQKYQGIKSKFHYFNFFALFPAIELQLLILQAILLPGIANANHKHQ